MGLSESGMGAIGLIGVFVGPPRDHDELLRPINMPQNLDPEAARQRVDESCPFPVPVRKGIRITANNANA
jgi:hypothetical protein